MQLPIVTENLLLMLCFMLEAHIRFNTLRVSLRSSIFFFFVFSYCFKSLAFLSSLATSLDRNRRWQRTQNQFKTLTVSNVVQFVIGFILKTSKHAVALLTLIFIRLTVRMVARCKN